MNTLKTAICTILSFFICLFSLSSPNVAYAQLSSYGRYAYADLDSTVYICTEKNKSTALFAIPQTYCVEILKEESEWLYVRYAEDTGVYRAVRGYCLADELVRVDAPLENSFLYSTFNVTFTADQITGVLPGLADIEMTAAYYGSYTVAGVEYSYVLCGDSFGYVKGGLNGYPLNTLPSQNTFTPVKEENDDTALVSVIAVCGIAALAIAVLFISCRTPKNKAT